MKKAVLFLTLISIVLLCSCRESVDVKAQKALDIVVSYPAKGGTPLEVLSQKVIYSASNDSLAVIKFVPQIKGLSDEMYFVYVVDDNDDYWVMTFDNPVAKAQKTIDDIHKGLTAILGEPKNNIEDSELLYSTIRLNASARMASGGGKTMSETKQLAD